MKRYRRGKNRCKICGWPLNDGNSHLHIGHRIWVDKLLKLIQEHPWYQYRTGKRKKKPHKKDYFSAEMLHRVKPLTKFGEFNKEKALPKTQGTIKFKRFMDLPQEKGQEQNVQQ